ncbi:MAG: hypothetical protein HPZ82_02675 [Coprobacter sp.]|nr:hypothetical protein [Coprobacter sp.]
MKLNKQYTSYILFILGALLLVIGLSSCEKSEGDKLYGRWQFRYCEYPDGGTFANDSIFYCFDRGVFELQKRSKGNGSARLHGLYTIADDSLSINFPSVSQFDLQDPPYHFGGKNSKGYRIDEVSRKNLVLSCRDTLYHFHKF